jgi:carbonic anhydrase
MSFRWEPFGRGEAPAPSPPRDLLDGLLAANRRRRAPPALPRKPARGLAIVTCMDARLDPVGALGLKVGDAHVIRIGGAAVSGEVLRSLAISRDEMGTDTVLVIGHTDCAGHGGDDEAASAAAREGASRAARVMPAAHALMYDVKTGRIARL